MKRLTALFVALLLLVSLVGCGSTGGVTQEDYDALRAEYDALVEEHAALQEVATNVSDTVVVDDVVSGGASVEDAVSVPVKTEYRVGDILEDGNTKIVFMSSGDYVEENKFLQPDDGNKYIYLQFAFENLSDTSDTFISYFSFDCYADGYVVEPYYGGEESLSATLSAGRATTGYIYFEVPVDAKIIEVEYEANVFTDRRIKFIFEGNKDSGYTPGMTAPSTESVYVVGDIVESNTLRISYLSCEEYKSDNMFIEPPEGYRFISCEFEFENLGSSDEHIISGDFDCYADDLACNASYARDDDLSGTLSTGRKVRGTVTFEVPIDATVVEVEYCPYFWTSNRVVFAVDC